MAVCYKGALVAGLEFKSQVGSVGKTSITASRKPLAPPRTRGRLKASSRRTARSPRGWLTSSFSERTTRLRSRTGPSTPCSPQMNSSGASRTTGATKRCCVVSAARTSTRVAGSSRRRWTIRGAFPTQTRWRLLPVGRSGLPWRDASTTLGPSSTEQSMVGKRVGPASGQEGPRCRGKRDSPRS